MFKMTENASSAAAERKTQQTICILPISVGQAYHEGKELDKAVTLINKSFDFCIIVPVDELHRHTAKIENHNLTDSEAIELTQKAGYDWEKRTVEEWEKRKTQKKTQGYVPGLTIPYAITHWEAWTRTDDYKTKKATIDDLYKNPEGVVSSTSEDLFHSQVDMVVSTFISGFVNSRQKKSTPGKKRLSLFNIKIATELTIEYLLEELAFVAMVSDGLLPLIPNLPQQTQPFKLVMAYPFGHNSTNKSVFNCFEEFRSDNFTFLNLSEKPKQKEVAAKIEQKPTATAAPQDALSAADKYTLDSSTIVVPTEDVQEQVQNLHQCRGTPHEPFTSLSGHGSHNDSVATGLVLPPSEEPSKSASTTPPGDHSVNASPTQDSNSYSDTSQEQTGKTNGKSKTSDSDDENVANPPYPMTRSFSCPPSSSAFYQAKRPKQARSDRENQGLTKR